MTTITNNLGLLCTKARNDQDSKNLVSNIARAMSMALAVVLLFSKRSGHHIPK